MFLSQLIGMTFRTYWETK